MQSLCFAIEVAVLAVINVHTNSRCSLFTEIHEQTGTEKSELH